MLQAPIIGAVNHCGVLFRPEERVNIGRICGMSWTAMGSGRGRGDLQTPSTGRRSLVITWTKSTRFTELATPSGTFAYSSHTTRRSRCAKAVSAIDRFVIADWEPPRKGDKTNQSMPVEGLS